MDIIIRAMEPNEALETKKIARKAFGVLERLAVPKPETALVAVLDGTIVGGFVYKFEQAAGNKIGFASFFFTDPSVHGMGIASDFARKESAICGAKAATRLLRMCGTTMSHRGEFLRKMASHGHLCASLLPSPA